jgi:outer membrane protein
VISVRLILRVLTLALIGFLPWAAQAQGKIGFVSTERVLRDAVPAQRAQKKLEADFKKRDQDLAATAGQLKAMQDEIERSSVTLSDSQRRAKEREFGELNREFQRKQREFREDLNQRRNEQLAKVVEQANRVIRSIAEQEELDVVIQDAVYANPRIDITDKVIKALEDK